MVKKIAIIGPECTGKTTLASQLAQHFSTIWIPEYARKYVANLRVPYTYEDVEHIAKVQFSQIMQVETLNASIVFFDTELIITKVWFEVVFQKQPDWLDEAIRNSNFAFYLLTDTSIPWVADGIRENGGARREELYAIYENYLNYFRFPYEIVHGMDYERLSNAISSVESYFKWK